MEKIKSVATSKYLPLLVIKYVAVTEEYMLLNDAKGDQRFESDYYIKTISRSQYCACRSGVKAS